MRIKILAFFALFAVALAYGTSPADSATSKSVKRAKANQLVTMLPASDAIMTFDVSRGFSEAFPFILSSKPDMLNKWMDKLGEFEQKSGIQLRSFDMVVAGMTVKQTGKGKYDMAPVMIARGSGNSSAVIAAAKEAAGGKYREESISGKTIYVFSFKEYAQKRADDAAAKDPENKGMIDKALGLASSEMAVMAIDANTVAAGIPDRVREMAEGRSKVGKDVVDLLNKKPFGVMNFAAKVPTGMSDFLPLDNDELGSSIDAIQTAFGSMDIVGGEMQMGMTARTKQPAQAEQLYDTMEVMQSFGKMALGSSKRADQQLYARLIERVKLARNGSDVSFDISVPQTDIDQLMAILVK